MPVPASPKIAVPAPYNWRTADEDEINRHRTRAGTGQCRVPNTDLRLPVSFNFGVQSGGGVPYSA
ncbi:MAG TPA: hypothetical protein PKI20_04255 [Verrucomicrobiota bacterium]|jgi:hypothetical protein|nr:hypothetical protein [Verrucomicrobiota bacterium]HQL76919.1 hypothetical protein [Verrucomicrobiota bacterium]